MRASGAVALFLLIGLVPTSSMPLRADDASRTVVSLGRLEPGEGVIDVGTARGDRVTELDVAEGDFVEAGQVLARLETFPELAAQAEARTALVERARQELRRVEELGPLEIAALQADIRRLEADLAVAESDLVRSRSLMDRELIPERDFEHQVAVTESAREQLRYSQKRLEQERERQKIDRLQLRAEWNRARAELAQAEAQAARARILAPVAGTILRIFTHPGETIADEPILRMGETQRMYAVAEVYETDVRFVRVGQKARVTSPALPEALTGTVERIGSMIHKNDVLDVDPGADTDSRIIEVRIRLDRHEVASRFVHLQVDVEIDPGGSGS